jgi:4-carboxymuconolactone decarboxylase
MTRLTPQQPDELSPEARAVYDRLTAGPRAASVLAADGTLVGPFAAMLLSPPVGDALQELGAALRYRSSLPDRAREIAILAVAAHWDSAFELATHRRIGASLGLSAEELSAVESGGPMSDPFEDTVLRVTRTLLAQGDLSDEDYTSLKPKVIFELTSLVGYYATLALQLRVFRVH